MRMKSIRIVMLALSLFAVASARAAAADAACNPNAIAVAGLDNNAVAETDKYWGAPADFGNTITYVLAFKLMWATGKPVTVINAKSLTLMGAQDLPDIAAVKKALGENPACKVVLGSIDQAIITTKKSRSLLQGKKKFTIVVKMRLELVDLAQDKTVINETFTNEHETTTLLQEFSNNNKLLFFPNDPVEAGGNPLGVPFSRIFNTFGKKLLELK
jgi:hypothetical protein